MKSQGIDFSKAQDLLIKLVEVLSPLTFRTVPASFFLKKRFMAPLSHVEFQHMQSRSITLLTDLKHVQKEMGEWLDQPLKEPSKSILESKENHKAKQEILLKANPKNRVNGETFKSSSLETKPIARQAEHLMREVHGAIAKLTSSSYFKNPQEKPLREVLNEIKPHLDQMIETVSDEEHVMEHQRNQMSPLIPQNSRTHFFQPSLRSQGQSISEKTEQPQIRASKKGAWVEKESVKESKSHQSKAEVNEISKEKVGGAQEVGENSTFRFNERTSLPAAPYQGERNFSNFLRKKKKKKESLFKDKEKERDHSD